MSDESVTFHFQLFNPKHCPKAQGAYHADVEQMRRDMAKHNDLLKRGWQIIYVTLEDFRNPAQFLDIIQVTVEQQHHLMGLKKVVR